MKIIVVINRAAGGIRDDSEARMRHVMRSAGLNNVEIVEFDRTLGGHQLRDLASQSPEFLVIWAGDGTHRTALNTLGREPSNLVLLPGGTRNLLAKSLHGAGTWDEILLGVLATPRLRELPAGRIDDELFFCAMLAGAPALFAAAREGLRDGDFARALDGVGRGLEAAQNMHLVVQFRDISSIEITRLPPTSIVGALVGFLADDSRMDIVALDNPTMFPALDVVWSSFHSGFRNLQGISIVPARTLLVENEGGDDIPTIVDGEPLHVGARFQARFVERGGFCLAAN
jgi:diacylglycerol kinase family enzyme